MEFKDTFYNTTDYKFQKEKLGDGTSGSVCILKSSKKNKKYVAKILATDDFNGIQQMELIQQSSKFHQLSHPSIVKFIGINFQSLTDTKKFEPTIISEYCPQGSLKIILENEKKGVIDENWNPTKKCISLIGISDALRYLHANGINHRNLKPENILFRNDFYPRVSDFGISDFQSNCLTKKGEIMIDTVLYKCPEFYQDEYISSPGVDAYAFGMLAYEITTGKVPFEELGESIKYNDFYGKISSGYRPKFPKNVTKKMQKLISRCWNANIEERPSFEEISSELTKNHSKYFNEKLDENEINRFIRKLLEKKHKTSNKPQTQQAILDHENQTDFRRSNEELCRSLIYLHGSKKEQNSNKCIDRLKISSEKGNSFSSFLLGLLYENGEGVKEE